MNSEKGNNSEIPARKKIAIHYCKELKIFDKEEIIYLEADGRYTKIHFKNMNPIICAKLLKNFESVLTMNFIRIHRSYIVNISYITKLINYKIIELADGTKLPIARRRYKSIVKRISSNIEII